MVCQIGTAKGTLRFGTRHQRTYSVSEFDAMGCERLIFFCLNIYITHNIHKNKKMRVKVTDVE